jgi:hypothetical protein
MNGNVIKRMVLPLALILPLQSAPGTNVAWVRSEPEIQKYVVTLKVTSGILSCREVRMAPIPVASCFAPSRLNALESILAKPYQIAPASLPALSLNSFSRSLNRAFSRYLNEAVLE